MKIDKVTITGADNDVDCLKLAKLTEKYPFVEWGVLFSKSREGTNRYPDSMWIQSLAKFNIPLSAHFCGWWAKQVLEESNFELMSDLHDSYKRIQLNYNFKNELPENGTHLLNYLALETNKDVIIQYNDNNAEAVDFLDNLRRNSNLNILYDRSGGRGTEIQEIESPFKSYTGYAGGINCDNVKDICEMITSHKSESTVWIDLESGVRTDDKFDLNKVETILEICDQYVKI
jgi:phosphoribosylanthranilate isomerase